MNTSALRIYNSENGRKSALLCLSSLFYKFHRHHFYCYCICFFLETKWIYILVYLSILQEFENLFLIQLNSNWMNDLTIIARKCCLQIPVYTFSCLLLKFSCAILRPHHITFSAFYVQNIEKGTQEQNKWQLLAAEICNSN